ncbi:MAG: DUF4399 domain-containing protein [Pseudorhodoplanes sp.]|nr:DUF4399 domain-containing protein [Pseudorhodoplanes sp.]
MRRVRCVTQSWYGRRRPDAAITATPVWAQQTRKGGPTPALPGAAVYFINLQDGARVPRTFTIQFGLRNMGLAAAGTAAPAAGHHHLLVDTPLPALNEPIPSDFGHLHFGAGQSEAEITLAPGEHTLQLLFADADHVPHATPVYSQRIRITVIEAQSQASAAPAPALGTPVRVKPQPGPRKREQRRRWRNPDEDEDDDW